MLAALDLCAVLALIPLNSLDALSPEYVLYAGHTPRRGPHRVLVEEVSVPVHLFVVELGYKVQVECRLLLGLPYGSSAATAPGRVERLPGGELSALW